MTVINVTSAQPSEQSAVSDNGAARHDLPIPPPAQGLLKEDLQVFVNGFIMTNMDLVEDECGGVPNDLDGFVDKVWACLDMDLRSDDKLVQKVTEAAQRALKSVHP